MAGPHQQGSRGDDLTRLLNDHNAGSPEAFSGLVEAAYDQLKNVARNRIDEAYGPRADEVTMQATALVNEAVMDLMKQQKGWENREHFFAIATRLMRRALIDYQRERMAVKRGGGNRGTSLDEDLTVSMSSCLSTTSDVGVIAMEAILRLQELDERKAEVATLHLKCGKSMRQIADMIGCSVPTVERDWRFVRAWLGRELNAAGVRVEK